MRSTPIPTETHTRASGEVKIGCFVVNCVFVFSINQDDKICVICMQGEYCDSGLNSSRPEFSTSPMNSSSMEDCICLPGYYQNTDNPTTHECIPCPVDSFCNDGVMTVGLVMMT